MKNLKILSLLASLLICSSLNRALALNEEDAELAAQTVNSWSLIVPSSQNVLVNLFYNGSASEAVVDITSSYIKAYAPAGTADVNFGVANSSFGFTTYNKLGSLCDAINNSTMTSAYHCFLFAGYSRSPQYLRDQTGATGTNDLKAAGGFDVKADSAAGTSTSTGYTNFMDVSKKPRSNKGVLLKACTANINTSGSAQLNVYGVDVDHFGLNDGVTRHTGTLVWGPIAVTTGSAQTISFNQSGIGGIEFGKNKVALVEVSNDNGDLTAAGQYLRCDGVQR